jgi:Protein of unknown function (DUF2490)
MKQLLVIPVLLLAFIAVAQNDRLNDYNNTNWLQTFNTIHLNKKWSLHVEYQWRREQGVKYWQQSLLRVGANYKINENIILHGGYAWVETYPYGDYPIASAGTFPEHRVYEQLTLRQPANKFLFTHRFRIEQRWLGRVQPGTDREIADWLFLHRFRYQFRTQYPFWAKGDKQLYGVAADELFIGAGKNVGTNIFDQNRIFLLLGFKLNKKISLEGGYFNQTLQQGRRVNNNTIMQRNNGVVLSSFINW